MFFDAAVAASLQYVTLPLELIGLTLATIEVRYPATAARIAGRLDGLAQRFGLLEERTEVDQLLARKEFRAAVRHSIRHFGDSDPRFDAFMAPLQPVFNSIQRIARVAWWAFWLALLAWILVSVLTWQALPCGPLCAWGTEFGWVAWSAFLVLLALGGAITLLFFGWLLLTGLSAFSSTFVEGRAVGTLGIVIASLGLLGEVYQLATQVALGN